MKGFPYAFNFPHPCRIRDTNKLSCFFKSEALAYCSLKSSLLTTLVLSLKKKKTITKYKNVNSIFFVKNTGFERESTTSWSVVYACAVLLAFPKVSRRFAALCAISLLLKSLQDFNKLEGAYCSRSLRENLVLRSKT